MGRAIVRQPKAFLFDEPLSNLDARLREAMRIEIGKLHRTLGATSVYVTHDQIEAMTMADKIVAMQGGVIQQIGTPLELYDDPANVFVAGFIGSPAMNMFDGTYRASGPAIEVDGGHRIPFAVRTPGGGRRAHHHRHPAGAYPRRRRGRHPGQGRAGGADRSRSTILHVRPFGATVKAFTLSRDAIVVGDTVTIRLPAEWLHLFDAQSGQRVT